MYAGKSHVQFCEGQEDILLIYKKIYKERRCRELSTRLVIMYKPKLEKDIRCPLEYGLDIFGGKWKSRIICVLSEKNVLRYSLLRKEMTNITDAVLANSLKELIDDGLVSRKQYDEIPPRVEYSLTEKGVSVVPILQSICRWSGIYYKSENDMSLHQCEKCDYR